MALKINLIILEYDFFQTNILINSLDFYNLLAKESIIDSTFRKSVELYKIGKVSESIKQFDNAIKQIKNNSNHIKMGILYFDFNYFYHALEYLDELLEIKSDDPNILARKGFVLEILSKYDTSLQYLDECLKIEPNNIFALRNKGILYLNTSEYERAIEQFDNAIKINPLDSESLWGKGEALEMIGKSNEALPCFIESMNLCQNNKELFDLAFHIIHGCSPVTARRYMREALEKNPNDILAIKIESMLSSNLELKEKIEELYDKYLHRRIDLIGTRYWIEQINNGKTLEEIEAQIKNSDEAKNYSN